MRRVLVVPEMHAAGFDVLAQRPDIRVDCATDLTEAGLRRAFADADAAILRAVPIGRSILEGAARLRVVSRHGVGHDSVDVACLTERRIPLTVTVDANALSVAEHAVFFLFALARNAVVLDRATRQGAFRIREALSCRDLAGKTLLLVGFGRIGRAVAVRAQALGLAVEVHDPAVAAATIAAAGCTPVARLDAALPRADYLSLHVPLVSGTRNLIGARELALMHPDACLINTARGGIVDEAALAEALAGGRLRGAALDVFGDEPPGPDNPLLALDNVILSPHAAALTRECAVRMAVASAENVLAAFDGRLDPSCVVNPEVLG